MSFGILDDVTGQLGGEMSVAVQDPGSEFYDETKMDMQERGTFFLL
jgi:hypothetical protein